MEGITFIELANAVQLNLLLGLFSHISLFCRAGELMFHEVVKREVFLEALKPHKLTMNCITMHLMYVL